MGASAHIQRSNPWPHSQSYIADPWPHGQSYIADPWPHGQSYIADPWPHGQSYIADPWPHGQSYSVEPWPPPPSLRQLRGDKLATVTVRLGEAGVYSTQPQIKRKFWFVFRTGSV